MRLSLCFFLMALLGCSTDSPGEKAAPDVATDLGSDPLPDTSSADIPADGPPDIPLDVPPDVEPPPDAPVDVDAPPAPNCTVFPADNPWNTAIADAPVHTNSNAFIARLGQAPLHPDFGTEWQGAPNGIPYVEVAAGQAPVAIDFSQGYPDESDPGPYPIPAEAPIEGGPNGQGDRHVIAVDRAACMLYELFDAHPQPDGTWRATSGAVFDMTSNALRPMGWTSADAAGLPIFPGLVRRDEVEAGVINHALRFTVQQSQRAIVLPATHWASSNTDSDLMPMGLRLRLKSSFDISGFSPDNKVILAALKQFGMIMADNGGDLFLSGAPSLDWSDDDLHALKSLTAADFEVVNTGPIYTNYEDVP